MNAPLRSQDQIVSEINALGAKAKQSSEKAKQYYVTRRQNIKELHDRWPDEWLQVVKEQCKIGERQAYKQLAIADGRTTEEKEREKGAISVQKVRNSAALRSAVTDAENIEEFEDNGLDGDMPTEEEADKSYQQTLYDQACLLLESMAGSTRQRFFAHLRKKYDVRE